MLAYIQIDGYDFNKSLVDLGFARVYEEGDSVREEDYSRSQIKAQIESLGLWSCAANPLNSIPSSLGTPTFTSKAISPTVTPKSSATPIGSMINSLFPNSTPIINQS
jgi:hypothetical protein